MDHIDRRRNFYGRRRGKKLRQAQSKLLQEELPKYSIAAHTSNACKNAGVISLQELFGRDCPVWIDVGFGAGEHLMYQAQRHLDVDFIGCEPYINGVASLLSKLRDNPLPNVRIYPDDVRDVIDVLPTRCISKVFLLYPDPWPKKKHHRRRFMTPNYLIPLANAMKHGAELRVATDIKDYAGQAVEQITLNHQFKWMPCSQLDWQEPWKDWQSTRYEVKALAENRTPIYLTFIRI